MREALPWMTNQEDVLKVIKIVNDHVKGGWDGCDRAIREYGAGDRRFPLEWRFMGTLGMGGKLRIATDGVPYVNCYPEDETPGRVALMDTINRELRIFITGDE